jgi:hypothetical protein
VEQLLLSVTDVQRISVVRQIEIHRVESLVPDPTPFEAEIAAAKFKRYKL